MLTTVLVHGHDDTAMLGVSDWIHALTRVRPIILSRQINRGQTLMEKFESYSKDAASAIVLMTPDDEARAKRAPKDVEVRARAGGRFQKTSLGIFLCRGRIRSLREHRRPATSVSASAEFIDSYERARGQVSTVEEREVAWAVSLRPALHNARGKASSQHSPLHCRRSPGNSGGRCSLPEIHGPPQVLGS
jgi:hypothetical protein